MRNCAIETTGCVKSSDGKHFRKVNYKSVISKVKKEFKGKFSGVQAHIVGATIKKHVDSFIFYIVTDMYQIGCSSKFHITHQTAR